MFPVLHQCDPAADLVAVEKMQVQTHPVETLGEQQEQRTGNPLVHLGRSRERLSMSLPGGDGQATLRTEFANEVQHDQKYSQRGQKYPPSQIPGSWPIDSLWEIALEVIFTIKPRIATADMDI